MDSSVQPTTDEPFIGYEPKNAEPAEDTNKLGEHLSESCYSYNNFCEDCRPLVLGLRADLDLVKNKNDLYDAALTILTKIKQLVLKCYNCISYNDLKHFLYHEFDDFADVIISRLDTTSMKVAMTHGCFVGYARAMRRDMSECNFIQFIAELPSRHISGDLDQTDNFIRAMEYRHIIEQRLLDSNTPTFQELKEALSND